MYQNDSLAAGKDTLLNDTADVSIGKKLPVPYTDDPLEADVIYDAEDSIIFHAGKKKVLLYGKAYVKYKEIELNADFIEFAWSENIITATGLPDTTGKIKGKPVFTEKDAVYHADRITYNYQTKKGKIVQLRTKEGEGYVHGEEVKKQPSDELFAKMAKYTTCELEDPHYSIQIKKMKIIPDKVVVGGPANLVVEDIPTPLFLPFGIFPIDKGQRSGIILPEYGDNQLGFHLRNGGYYFALNDYIDLALRGDIYTSGSWKVNPSARYKKRYRYSGAASISYSRVRQGEPLIPEQFSISKDFSVKWRHKQEPEARPGTNFSADVNVITRGFNKFNSYNTEDFLNNTFRSSVSYTKNWLNSPFSLSSSLTHSQNTKTGNVNLILPDMALTMRRIFPFKRRQQKGSGKWYEQIGLSYKGTAKNSLNVKDSLIFKENSLDFHPDLEDKFKAGFSHSIPFSFSSFKIFKYFTFSPSLSYHERWSLKRMNKTFVGDTVINGDSVSNYIRTETINDFVAGRDLSTKFSLNTILYGMINFRKGKIKAIRHVFKPSIDFRFQPDISTPFWGNYGTVKDGENSFQKYSFFEGNIAGSAPQPGMVSGLGLNLNNNFEMKVLSKKDTVNKTRKIKLLDYLNISTFYNFAADSLQMHPVRISGRTTLFKKLNFSFGANLDPYITDSLNRRVNQLALTEEQRPLRLTNANFSFSTSLRSLSGEKDASQVAAAREYLLATGQDPDAYVNYNIPWDLSVNYNASVIKTKKEGIDTAMLTQSLRFNGNLSITPNWKIGMDTGYDFVEKDFSHMALNIYRNLHCWEMKIRWIPFGPHRSYSIDINVKASILQDLKITKKEDNFLN